MGFLFGALAETFRQPTIGGLLVELVILSVPVWIALFAGLLVGWVWRPRWATDFVRGEKKNNSVPDLPQLQSSSLPEMSGKSTSVYDNYP